GPRESPLADARPVPDPFVGGVDDRLEVRVGDDPVGDRTAHAGDPSVPAGRHRPASNHTSGCPGWTGSPSRTSTPATTASKGLFTSMLTDPCSITATGCPALTHSWPSWNRTGGRWRIRPAAGETTRKKPNPPADSPMESGVASDGTER